MQIPIRNLYVMLCYAWDVLDPSDAAVTSTESGPGAENLLGALLLFVLRPVLRRGLHREYSTRSEEGALPGAASSSRSRLPDYRWRGASLLPR